MKIKLETSEGHLVHKAQVPFPMSDAPEVVYWGIRVFTKHATEKRPNGFTIYREVFALALIPSWDYPLTQE